MSSKCQWVPWLRARLQRAAPVRPTSRAPWLPAASCVVKSAPPRPSQAIRKRVRETQFRKWGEDLVGFTHLWNDVTHSDKQLPSNHRRREEREKNKSRTPSHSRASERLLWPEAAYLVHSLRLFLSISLCPMKKIPIHNTLHWRDVSFGTLIWKKSSKCRKILLVIWLILL